VPNQVWLWVGFNVFVLGLLGLDLGIVHRKAQVIRIKEALIWSAVWVVVALLFNVGVYFWLGAEAGLSFLAGYLIERSLSVDNIFVFLLIFSYFRVPEVYQYRVLFWGILGALVTRALLIAAGVTLIQQFHWVIYIFGAFLIFTGVKLVTQKYTEIQPEKNPVLRLFRRLMPVTSHYEGEKFFVSRAGRYFATPLLVVLLVIETTDVIFALDSIPAILGITIDPFVVYTSNVVAILGLRALYFAVVGLMRLFRYLDYGLSAVLVFVGAKMLVADFYEMPVGLALGVVAGILSLAILASVVLPDRSEAPRAPALEDVEASGAYVNGAE